MNDPLNTDDHVATAVFVEVALALNAAMQRHAAPMTSVLIASNQLNASVLAYIAGLTRDPQASIDNFIDALRERIADIQAGRVPQLIGAGQ